MVYYINVKTKKNNNFTFETFKIVLVNFQVENKLGQAWYFQKTFLLADISVELILRMFFLIFNNANI